MKSSRCFVINRHPAGRNQGRLNELLGHDVNAGPEMKGWKIFGPLMRRLDAKSPTTASFWELSSEKQIQILKNAPVDSCKGTDPWPRMSKPNLFSLLRRFGWQREELSQPVHLYRSSQIHSNRFLPLCAGS